MKNPELLHTASEQFLGKKEHEIKSTVLQTLEGHLRAILGKASSLHTLRLASLSGTPSPAMALQLPALGRRRIILQ